MDENVYDYIRKNNSKLYLEYRKNIIRQICKGLSYIHNKGLLRRDISLTNVFVKKYDDVIVVKIGDFGLVKLPNSTLTSSGTEFKGSLNDPDLINIGFDKYEMKHETYALTQLCFFILIGKTNISNQKEGDIKEFWRKGTNTQLKERFVNVDQLLKAVALIKDNV